ncbi:hypothetical protein B0H14DRAFT_1314685 [Mycena olivaceomarginata]|nr:hypothetical protein B0H14DRAFT_1314685 [Mycena olivaceomarginata]
MPRRTQPHQLRVVQLSIVVPCPTFLPKSITPPTTALSNTCKFYSIFWDSGERLHFSYLLSMHLTTVPFFSRLRGQLNPVSPCIPDALFFPSQPVKAIPLESELWCDGSTPAATIFSIPRRPASKVNLRRWYILMDYVVFLHPTPVTMYCGRHHRASSASTR